MKAWRWLAGLVWLANVCWADSLSYAYDIDNDIPDQRDTLLALYSLTSGAQWTAIGSLDLSRLNISTSQPGIDANLLPSNFTNSSVTSGPSSSSGLSQLEQQIALLELLVTYPWNTTDVSYCQWQVS